MAAEKKYIVAWPGAGQHEQGAIVTRSDCGPDGAWFDRWLELGAIRAATADEVKAAASEADPRSPELTTGDDKIAETETRRSQGTAPGSEKVETPTDRAAAGGK